MTTWRIGELTVKKHSGLNCAISCSGPGLRPVNDDFGEQLLANARHEGIGVMHVGRDETVATGVPMIAVDANGQNSIAVASGANYSIDTAAVYKNERGVGKAIRESGIPREDIFLTTKVWNSDQRAKRTMAAFEQSLERLGTEYVDLYLVHWPVKGFIRETWQVMEEIHASGRARAIGVSNFMIHHLEDVLADFQLVPAVNQIEFHPYLLQPELLQFCEENQIQVEAWSPLVQGQIVNEPRVQRMAERYQKTPAQIALRWDLQHEVVTIPKSARPSRIAENAQIFDFELSTENGSV